MILGLHCACMDVFESVAWVALGFVPTLIGLEVASRRGLRIGRIIPIRGSKPTLGGYPSLSSGKEEEIRAHV